MKLQRLKSQNQRDILYTFKTRPCAPKTPHSNTPPHMSTSRCGNICVMHPKCSRKERRRGFSNAVVWKQPCQGDAVCFYGKQKHYLTFRKQMHLGIIKITYNRTATDLMDDRFVNLGEEVILTFLWQSGASESATVCSVISLSICYWLLKYGVLRVVCVCVCVGDKVTQLPLVQTHTFMHLADAFIQSDLQLYSGYTISLVCVPWESNPQPFALLTQCSTTEPHRKIQASSLCLSRDSVPLSGLNWW